MAKKKRKAQKVYVLSGGTGRTVSHVLESALAQFVDPVVNVVSHFQILTVHDAVKAVKDAAKENAILLHTLVSPEVREAVVEVATLEHVRTFDILGPALALLEDSLQTKPQRQPGLSHELSKERYNRIDAVDFTLAHDDGCLMGELDQADVVLVGVSRVSKSVTCFYLAYRGIRAANVPIVGRSDPPEELVKLDPAKVVGLTMNARRLTSLREARAETFGAAQDSYVDEREIGRELGHTNAMIEKHGWHWIDVSYKSVEEVAYEILKRVRK
ncbi:MAG: kinase/pyrophosphorylase [Planctomycetaceae bacterium]|nr:kinase/pyrophosphorylase [Planctomycetales bacterium]MCB9921665.1 kinase/pyrophosphorylase [Planctomycetaceae bacterium]